MSRPLRILGPQISRRLLPAVRQPAQYVGGETHARHKDLRAAEVTLALAFPDTYSVGISHLGSELLYALANDLPWAAADRAYCPLPDAEALLRQEGLPLFGWESRAALADLDVLGLSLSYEGNLTCALAMLDLAGIPLRAADRTETHPLVVAGGALAEAPEPMADFIDIFCLGDGEVFLPALLELLRQAKPAGATRREVLLQAARTVPGAYVPALYAVAYHPDGTLAALTPQADGVPERVARAHLADLSASPALMTPLVPLAEAVHDRVTIEIMRGCPHGCRFCQAGATRKPVRVRPVEEILEIATAALAATGHRSLSLLSLSSSEHPQFGELVAALNRQFVPRNISVSLPSLRVDAQLAAIPQLTSQVRKSGLTIAAEAGSARLRAALRKDISEESMRAGVAAAWSAGWRSVKVYFLAGLPGETDADIDAIVDLCRGLSDTRRAVDGQRGAINAAVSWLVPRPHTAMQWEPMAPAERFWTIRHRLRERSRRSPVSFRFHRIERSILEAVIARGDRRVGRAIEAAYRAGARFDGWDEHFRWDLWEQAFRATDIDPYFYAHRRRGDDEPLPWDHLQAGPSRQALAAQRDRMHEALG